MWQVLVELEWQADVDACVSRWVEAGISSAFLSAHPEGVTWGCEVCAGSTTNAAAANISAGGGSDNEALDGTVSMLDKAEIKKRGKQKQ